MSRENVETIRSLYEAVARADYGSILVLLEDDVEYVNPDGALEPGIRRGRSETARAFQQLGDSFSFSRITVERIAAVGNRVVAVINVEGVGRDSGSPFRRKFGTVVTFRSGKVVRYQWFLEPAEALEAVGLRE